MTRQAGGRGAEVLATCRLMIASLTARGVELRALSPGMSAGDSRRVSRYGRFVDAGFFTLLGALIGGIASLAGTVYVQNVQSRRERLRLDAEAKDRALIAARLVQGDLAWAEARIVQAMSKGKYWSQRYALRDESWLTYREVLALSLESADDWVLVHDAFRSIQTMELRAARGRTEDPLFQPDVGGYGARRLPEVLSDVRQAMKVLEPRAGRIKEESADQQ